MSPGIRLATPDFGLKPRSVAVALLPDRIDVIVRKGNALVVARRIPITLGFDPNTWVKGVRAASDDLRDVVVELGVERVPTAVVYTSPTQAVDLVSLNLDSAAQARAAAILGCMETIPYPFDAAVVEAVVVGRDRAEDNRQIHVVVAADRQDVTGAMVEMTEAAGLEFQSATPIAATIMARLAGRALRYLPTERGWLYVGDHGSFFVVGGRGILRFGRAITIGLETLVESLTRPIRSSGTDEPIELDVREARDILYRQGIAGADEVIHGHAPLRMSQLAPLVQPVLQRFVVELRQSIRFGVPEAERESVMLVVTGAGSAVPGFAALLGRELALSVSLDSRYAAYEYDSPASAGSEGNLAVANRRYLTQMNLQPQEITQRRDSRWLRRWLWAGVAAALVIIALDTVWLQVRLGELRGQETALAHETAGLETLRDTQARLAAAVQAMDGLRGSIAQQIGAHVDFRAVFHELSRLTPQSIQLTTLTFRRNGDQMNGTASGYAAASQDADGQTELEAFIEALKLSPIIDNVELVNVQVASVGGTMGERFEAGFQAIAIPSSSDLEATPAVVGDSQ
ncbi:MAG: PilN domain-containing protein [Phycisphaerales bacterium]